jgi:hypothetical protein
VIDGYSLPSTGSLDAGEKGGESLDLHLGCERLGIWSKPLEMEMASCGSEDGASTL